MQSHSMRIGRGRIENRKFTEGHTSPIDLCYPNGKMLLSILACLCKRNFEFVKKQSYKTRMKYSYCYTWNTHYRARAYGEIKKHSLRVAQLKLKPKREMKMKKKPTNKRTYTFLWFSPFFPEKQKKTHKKYGTNKTRQKDMIFIYFTTHNTQSPDSHTVELSISDTRKHKHITYINKTHE